MGDSGQRSTISVKRDTDTHADDDPVAAVHSRFAEAPYRCPFCGHLVHKGQVIAQVVSGTTASSGCFDCAWAAQNGELPTRREAS